MNESVLRRDFPILNRKINGKPLVYLDNAATSQKPQQVIDALVSYYALHNANVHRGVHTLGDESTSLYQSARQTIAQFIGAANDQEIIFTRNTTEAINLLTYAWGMKHLQSGDEVVTTNLEHHSNFVTWQRLCQLTGAKLIIVILDPNQPIEPRVIAKQVNSRTKLVALTHVSNVTGTKLDMVKISRLVKKRSKQTVIMLDAAQSVPHEPVKVSSLFSYQCTQCRAV